jgi:hypothetical protein
MKKAVGLCIAGLTFIASCDQWGARDDQVDDALIDRIERGLAQNRCVGTLSRWVREYAYLPAYADARWNSNTIEFTLYEPPAGVGVRRFVILPEEYFRPDEHRHHGFAKGHYDIQANTLTIVACGQIA